MRRSSRISEQVEAKAFKPSSPEPEPAKVAKRPKPKKRAKPKQPAAAAKPTKADNRPQTVQDIVPILDSLDDKLRMLFHLEKFVSLVYFDPTEAKHDDTAVFREWLAKHDPWEPILNAAPDRVARKKYMRAQDFVAKAIKRLHVKERPTKKPRRSVAGSTTAVKEEPQEYEATPEPIAELAPTKPDGSQIEIAWTHPSHIVKPQFGSLGALLGSWRSLEEDQQLDEARWDQLVSERAEILRKLAAARGTGQLDSLQKQSEISSIAKFSENRQTTHLDHLLGQSVFMGKRQINLRKIKLANAKKTAQNIEAHFKRQAGAEERLRKDQERDRKALHRKLAYEVLKKWKLAEKVVEQRRQLVLDEENKIKGKQYLNEILQKSEQLLQNQQSVSLSDEMEALSDEMEALSSEPESASSSDDNEDENLTVEQLREKYGAALDAADGHFAGDEGGEDGDGDDEDDEEEDGDEEDNEYEENITEDIASIAPEELARMKAAYDQEAEDEEEELDDSESDSESAASSAENGPSALSQLFGKVEDDSDEVVMSDEVASDVDMSASSGDEARDESSDASDASAEPTTPQVENQDPPVQPLDPQETQLQHYENKIEPPFLLRGSLRKYQRAGLDWLAGLYNSQTNGILADEMGLGKTIQTISLLAYLACEKHVWGPHLIVVPTSVMLNWEMEFKRFAPGFKVLTYYGNPQQRKDKRRGWNKEDTWHVCITSYQLVIQDQAAFKRKRWKYMILDEAHNIKNFRSQRWQALLNFNSERRLLLTGTPLQNNLVELWSLLYFLMPSSKGTQMMPEGFANLEDFQEWFSRPVDQMVEEGTEADEETRNTISKLHQVLRPYILRRLKADVEKQMPGKYEHIIYCKLSKRQRYLYDDFMSRAQTQETLASGNFMSILNCLMQLRKVCNHPDLFEVRPIKTSWAIQHSAASRFRHTAALVTLDEQRERVNLDVLNLVLPNMEGDSRADCLQAQRQCEIQGLSELSHLVEVPVPTAKELTSLQKWAQFSVDKRRAEREALRRQARYLAWFRSHRVPVYGRDLREAVTLRNKFDVQPSRHYNWNFDFSGLALTIDEREAQLKELVARFAFVTPEVVCLDQPALNAGPITRTQLPATQRTFHEEQVRLSIQFPDKRLLQYDCGKLQKLDGLLRDLIPKGHRVLIFTQMTRVLDILEQFLNIHGHRYLRLDGATRVEERQVLTERFNKDPTIPVFILSTRSGGLGINLTGADTVVFYDSDWNPAMDKQCQDRCHRIGQTRDVHIYRFVSEYTIESNILRKATQKTILDNVVIQEGDFTTDYFKKFNVKDIITGETTTEAAPAAVDIEAALAGAEDADDIAAANMALSEARLDQQEFREESVPVGDASADTGDGAATGDAANGSDVTPRASTTPGPDVPADAPADAAAHVAAHAADAPEDSDDEAPDGIGPIDDWMIRFIESGLFE